MAEWLPGRLAAAEEAFESSLGWWRRAGQVTTTAWGYYCLARLQRGQGRLDSAVRTCERALEAAGEPGRRLLPAAGPALTGLGQVDCPTPSRPSAPGCIWLRETWRERSSGRLTAASMPKTRRVTRASRASSSWPGCCSPGDRADRALVLLGRLDAAAAAQRRIGSLIEIRAIRAVALAALGDDAGATAALTSALQFGCAQGYIWVFADEGPAMAAVLGQLIAAQRNDQRAAAIPVACLARLQRAFGAGGAAGGGATRPQAPRLIEQLTGRKREVLAMLAAGQSNQTIASRLFVSLDTVKKHVSHVLGKLGAANRTEAVARARELGLIP
jgi:ATP/maltotriose-dependent transcriptional regulator MalT